MAPGKEFAKTCNRIPSPTLLGFGGMVGVYQYLGGQNLCKERLCLHPVAFPEALREEESIWGGQSRESD